ncbi:MAG: hypothetical protein LC115_04955, partial [Bacteroidia bacterium]|nr:hypothetical protein [Bacteroidia bacterium]
MSSASCTASTSSNISVLPVVIPNTASNNGPVCQGNTLQLSTQNLSGATFLWQGPGGYTSSTQSPTRSSVTPSMAGVYSLSVTLNAVTITTTTTVTIQGAIGNNTIGNSQSILSGNTPAQFTGATPSGGNGSYTYSWQQSTNAGSTWTVVSGATAINYQAGAISATTYFRRVVSSASCTASTSSNISVLPVVIPNTASNNGPVCQGNTLQLSTQNLSGATFLWQGPGGYTSSTQSPTRSSVTPSMAGVYSLSVTLNAVTITTTTTVTIQGAIGNNTIGSSQSILSGGTPAQFTGATPSGGNGSYSYSWQQSTNAGSTWTVVSGATATNYQAGTISATTYFRRVVSSASCTASTSGNISVLSLAYTITASNNGPIYEGQTLNLSANPSNPGGTYSWVGPNGYTGTGQYPTIPNATLAAGGVYTVTQSIDNITISATTTPVVLQVLGPNVITSSQTILSGTTPAGFTGTVMTGGTGSYTYQWERSTNGGSTWTTV